MVIDAFIADLLIPYHGTAFMLLLTQRIRSKELKHHEYHHSVIPAHAGIHVSKSRRIHIKVKMGPRVRGGDGLKMAVLTGRRSLLAGVLAAIGASVCCVGPLVLLGLGVSGAWIGNLTALEPYRPIFVGLTLVFLGLAFRKPRRFAGVWAPMSCR